MMPMKLGGEHGNCLQLQAKFEDLHRGWLKGTGDDFISKLAERERYHHLSNQTPCILHPNAMRLFGMSTC